MLEIHPLLKSSFIDDGKPIRLKVQFLDVKWNYDSLANPGRAPILRTRVRNKEINEQMHCRNIRSGRDSN